MLLTNDLSARVVRRDGHSASGTLVRFLQPHFHTGRAEHVVVGADHRLSDLQTARAHIQYKHTNTIVHFNDPLRHKLSEYYRWSYIDNYLVLVAALWLDSAEPGMSNRGFGGTDCSVPGLGCYLSEAYLTRDRQSQTESRRLEVESHCNGGGTHAVHKQYTTSVEGGTNFPPVRLTTARFRPQTTGSQKGQSTCDFSNKPSNQ